MSEITDRSSYQIPTSAEVVSRSYAQQAWIDAITAASEGHPVNPETEPLDTSRIETSLGGATLAACETADVPVLPNINPAEIPGYGMHVGELLEFYRQQAQQAVAGEYDGK